MLVITRDDVRKVITMRDAIEAVKRGFALFSQSKAIIPLRVSIKLGDNATLFMPGATLEDKCAGVKVVSVCPFNPQRGLPLINAAVLIIDGETGVPQALIEGSTVTTIRTGAAGGAAAEALSNEDSKVALVIGAGVQGRIQIEALSEVRDIELVYVYDIDTLKAEIYAKEMTDKMRLKVMAVRDYESVIPEADVIITATTSNKPVLRGKYIKEGVHINAIGSYTPDMKELDIEVFKRASVVAVDSKEAVLEEAGEVIEALREAVLKKEDIVEIGEILAGVKAGRRSKEEITVFKTVGIAVEDVVVGKLIYERAKEKGVGIEIKDF
ncbi:MAG: ornithine cyclodeaminase family protein [Synergistetes bacterium]|nr:ornithine cyclodeaminase family protein [Synergistota bacterium]MDW8192543.1 ornithine cyclodeaminase family protein [Synergistota bacterium]